MSELAARVAPWLSEARGTIPLLCYIFHWGPMDAWRLTLGELRWWTAEAEAILKALKKG